MYVKGALRQFRTSSTVRAVLVMLLVMCEQVLEKSIARPRESSKRGRARARRRGAQAAPPGGGQNLSKAMVKPHSQLCSQTPASSSYASRSGGK